jgi:hypothetical protein
MAIFEEMESVLVASSWQEYLDLTRYTPFKSKEASHLAILGGTPILRQPMYCKFFPMESKAFFWSQEAKSM